eukprot:TRINITY_DN8549_c0_g1_i1.p2 TRINITY_DN8549_c0_g1~~TRINITY_DN8549_c0_g1_i1.p2  ORF type:complete len:166 (-),score=33.26 TRINITY_DN8549_c0_g1_i1:242-739(-)
MAATTPVRRTQSRLLAAVVGVSCLAVSTLLACGSARDEALLNFGSDEPLGKALRVVFPVEEGGGSLPHLIGFYADQSMEAKRMRYLGSLLEEELPGTKIVWLEAWANPINERLRATIDIKGQCGGVPYLFNRKTGKVLCGVVSYDKLRMWAKGMGGDARIFRDIR